MFYLSSSDPESLNRLCPCIPCIMDVVIVTVRCVIQIRMDVGAMVDAVEIVDCCGNLLLGRRFWVDGKGCIMDWVLSLYYKLFIYLY